MNVNDLYYGSNEHFGIGKTERGEVKPIGFPIVIDGTLTGDDITKLNEFADAHPERHKPGKLVGDGNQSRVKYSFIHMKRDEIWFYEDFMTKIINATRAYEAHITQVLEFRIITYEVGCFFDWHTDDQLLYDTDDPNLTIRKMTFLSSLTNAKTYEGGTLHINPMAGVVQAFSTRGPLCQTVGFPAHFPHKVDPITKGRRRSLVVWLCGPRWK